MQDVIEGHVAGIAAQSTKGSMHMVLQDVASAQANPSGQAPVEGVEQVPEPDWQTLSGVREPALHDGSGQDELEQQMRSTHVRVVAQSPVTAHTAPAGRPVQVPAVVLHFMPLAHSPSAEHDVRQAVPLQAYPPGQAADVPAVHIPTPSQ